MLTDDSVIELYEATKNSLALSKHIPLSTYRLQFSNNFKFKDATDLLPYLHELGITDCYASPYLKARHGSAHGYDISDHNTINPEIGSPKDYQRFAECLKKCDMEHILDFVPNHMGIFENPWWQDVLENGHSSPYSEFFDIDWKPIKTELNQKVLLPILEDLYGKVLEQGHITIIFEKGAFFVNYYVHKLPIDPKSAVMVLDPCLNQLKKVLGDSHTDYAELQSIITAINNLPSQSETDAQRLDERKREKEVIKRRLHDLYRRNNNVRKSIQSRLQEINGKTGDSSSCDELHEFLEAQAYRLSYWRVAGEEINYRRFFDINELVGLNMESQTVFEITHKLVLQLLVSGKIKGLRIDHVDGLFSPSDYLWQLQKSYLVEVCFKKAANKHLLEQADITSLREKLLKIVDLKQANNSSNNEHLKFLYLIVEKILGDREILRKNWPVEGTTGYEYEAILNGIYVDKKNAASISNIYKWFTGKDDTFRDIVYHSKSLVMRTSMAAELNVLAHQLDKISERNRTHRDFTLNNLRDAIREVIAFCPVYRTYINALTDSIDEVDNSIINIAVAAAKRQNPAINAAVFDFIKDILLLQYPANISDDERNEQRQFIMRLQQFTGSVMAKGMEDTAFYIYNPLISLNEVGNNPQRLGNSVEEFHKHNIQRYKTSPHSMISTSTHDSKRSEDVRARINVISEIPQEWKNALMRWSRLNRDKKGIVDDEHVPSKNEEYYLYQTLLGTYPIHKPTEEMLASYLNRIQNHMLKSIREAKINTSWISPNTAYEESLQKFIAEILDPSPQNTFLADFITFNKAICHCGIYNSLSQTVLKMFSPGVPDIYQGNEIWTFNLTDPDNRRPVNFTQRKKLLKQINNRVSELKDLAKLAQELLSTKEDGRIKLYVTMKSLNYRRTHVDLFPEGSYIPLKAVGDKRRHICAFAWQKGNKKLIVIAPVLVTGLSLTAKISPLSTEAWGETYLILPKEQVGQTYYNIFTSQNIRTVNQANTTVLPLAEIFAIFPVAALELKP